MKRNFGYVVLIISLMSLIGCVRTETASSSSSTDSSKLTTEKAQATLSRWISDGQVTVRGIQEVPKENAAKVDLTFSNFRFKANGSERTYSGPGTAIFTHYNDGRWVLIKVSTEQGFYSVWWNNLNIEVH